MAAEVRTALGWALFELVWWLLLLRIPSFEGDETDALSLQFSPLSLAENFIWNPSFHFVLLIFSTTLTIVGLIVGALFYSHVSKIVFNCNPGSVFCNPMPFFRMLPYLRPISLSWRLLTVPLRTLPDVYVVGEARCGTTTLCHHLRQNLQFQGPFSAWDMELANDKESFYWVRFG